MSKETSVFSLGILVFFIPFLGVPQEYKEWTLITSGVLLTIIGYRLRRRTFLKSIESKGGERRGDAFVESDVVHNNLPQHKDSELVS